MLPHPPTSRAPHPPSQHSSPATARHISASTPLPPLYPSGSQTARRFDEQKDNKQDEKTRSVQKKKEIQDKGRRLLRKSFADLPVSDVSPRPPVGRFRSASPSDDGSEPHNNNKQQLITISTIDQYDIQQLNLPNNSQQLKLYIQQSNQKFQQYTHTFTDLIELAAATTRTSKELKVIQNIEKNIKDVCHEYSVISHAFQSHLSLFYSTQSQLSHEKSLYSSLRSKLDALDFDTWCDQHILQESITALEKDIRRIGDIYILKQPKYQYSIHPVANLVFRKFMRLEELIFLLRKQIATQASTITSNIPSAANGGIIPQAASKNSHAMNNTGSNTTSAVNSPTNANDTNNAASSTTSNSTTNNPQHDLLLSNIIQNFGSLQGIIKENETLRKRNKMLTLALKQLRHHPQTQAAMQLMSPSERASINRAVTPALTQSLAVDYASLRPAVYTFLAKYDSLLIQLFDHYARAQPASNDAKEVAVAYDNLRKTTRNIMLDEIIHMAKEFEIIPHALSAAEVERVVRVCVESSQFIIESCELKLGFYEFKEFIARLALISNAWQYSLASPSNPPTQLDKVRALLYELDMTSQDRAYQWRAKQLNNQSGVMGFLSRYDRNLRLVYIQYSNLITPPYHLLNDRKQHHRSMLCMNLSQFQQFVHDFGIVPDLLNQEQIKEIFESEAVSNSFNEAENSTQNEHDGDNNQNDNASANTESAGTLNHSLSRSGLSILSASTNQPVLLFPEFKLSLSRIALLANQHFPSLDPRSLFEEENFDPSLTIVIQFFKFLNLSEMNEKELRFFLDKAAAQHTELNDANNADQSSDNNSTTIQSETYDVETGVYNREGVTSVDDASNIDVSYFQESDEQIIETFQHALQQIFSQFAHSVRIAPNGTGSTPAISWKEFQNFCENFRVAPQLTQLNLVSNLFLSSLNVPKNSKLFQQQQQAKLQAISIANGTLDSMTELIEPPPLVFSEFTDCLVKIARSIQTDGYHENVNPLSIFFEFLISRFVYDWSDATSHPAAQSLPSTSFTPRISTGNNVIRPRVVKRTDIPNTPDVHVIESRPYTNDDQTYKAKQIAEQVEQFENVEQDTQDQPQEETDESSKSDETTSQEEAVPSTANTARQSTAPTTAGSNRISTSSISFVYQTVIPTETTFAWLKPDAVRNGSVDSILQRIQDEGFEIVSQKYVTLTPDLVNQFYAEHIGKPFFAGLCSFMTSGRALALALRKQNAILDWRALMGPTSTAAAKSSAPNSLRALYGTDNTMNATHGSDSKESSERELQLVFSNFSVNTPGFLMVLPDVVSRGDTDMIVERLKEENFTILLQQSVKLSVEKAQQFYHSHPLKLSIQSLTKQLAELQESSETSPNHVQFRTQLEAQLEIVRTSFQNMIDFLRSGPVLLLAVRADHCLSRLKELVGPEDVNEAKLVAPDSLRAIFGSSLHKNGVYLSTDLPSVYYDLSLTADGFVPDVQDTLCIIKPEAVAKNQVASILHMIEEKGFEITARRQYTLSSEQAQRFYHVHQNKPFFPTLVEYMSSGPIYACSLRRLNAINAFRTVSGPTNPDVARQLNPSSIRAHFGTDVTHNAVHSSDSIENAKVEIKWIMEEFREQVEMTVAFIKPDAVASQRVDAILKRITDEQFEIVRIEDLHLTEQVAQQFFSFSTPASALAIKFLCSGPLLALCLRKENGIAEWKRIVGASDPVLAKGTDQQSLRALYGTDKIRNALHASENVASAQKEIKYLFEELYPLSQTTLLILKPDLVQNGHAPNVLQQLQHHGYDIVRSKIHRFTSEQVRKLYHSQIYHADFPAILTYMTSNVSHIYALKKNACIRDLKTLCGPADPEEARSKAPLSLRAVFGVDKLHNGIHCSNDWKEAVREVPLMFNEYFPPIQQTLALLKPDLVMSGFTETVLKRIASEGFEIMERKKIQLTPEQVQLFYAEHVGKPFFNDLATFMTSNPVIALRLRKEDCIASWRALMGPTSTAAAKSSAPNSLRALYGTDNTMNATHGSDSVESAARELDLIFNQFIVELQDTYAMIKPDAYGSGKSEAILKRIRDEGFEIVSKSKLHFSKDQAEAFYAEHKGRVFYPALIGFMSGGPLLAMVLRKENAIKAWRDLLGPTDSNQARMKAPNSIRALYGTDGQRNACHGSDSKESAAREINLVFDGYVKAIETTLAVIKPDAIANGHSKAIIQQITTTGFEIVNQVKLTLTQQQALRFYCEHAGAFYYSDLIKFITSGPIIALALRKENAIKDFLMLSGPSDSTIARKSHPQSIRSIYGIDRLKNAVHGAESKANAEREMELIFKSFAVGVQDTLAIIKPDATQHESVIIQRLKDEGFEVDSIIKRQFSRSQISQLYFQHINEPWFSSYQDFMSSGPSICVLLRKENGVKALRELVGPTDPHSLNNSSLDADTLRVLYGTDRMKNGLHASKTIEQATHEIDLIFKQFFVGSQTTFALLTPDAITQQHDSAIFKLLNEEGFEIVRQKALTLTPDQVKLLFPEAATRDNFALFNDSLTCGPCVALELRGESAIRHLLHILGSGNSAEAQAQPNSIRALYATDQYRCAMIASDNEVQAKQQATLVFDTFVSQSQTIVCVIKPDAVKKNADDAIVKRITDSGFEVLARKKIKLSSAQAKALYAAHSSKPYFKALIDLMTGSASVCLALRKNNALDDLNVLIGPTNPRIAKKTHPNTIRAVYGTEAQKNAIHAPADLEQNKEELNIIFPEYSFDLLG